MACPPDPDRNCPNCPRLVAFRQQARLDWPGWFNAPVPSFVAAAPVRLLIVGLAPGLRGANRTGRTFTGDYAGELLYKTLIQHGFAQGEFDARPDDGLTLRQTMITNAVRCVPPQNKPLPAEMHACRPFLEATIACLDHLKAIVALGRVAHDSVLRAFGLPLSRHAFRHGGCHSIGFRERNILRLYDSYHCSRYNTNTGVLTDAMFDAVFTDVSDYLRRQ